MPRIYLWLAVLVGLSLSPTDGGSGVEKYCLTQTFKAECGPDDVIMMDEAFYGRMRSGECVKQNYGHVGCSKDVLYLADRKCSGRRACAIGVPDAEFESTQPCPGDLKNYLEASYHCKNVVTAAPEMCETSRFARVLSPHGHLSSLVTAETGCGTAGSPWLIEAKPGQAINLTLIDFAWTSPEVANDYMASDGFRKCYKYGVIRDMTTQQDVTLCGNTHRVHHLYKSISNTVEIEMYVSPGEDNPRHYLIQFDVVGCDDLNEIKNGYFKREGDVARVGCNGVEGEWILRCENSRWVGETANCSGTGDKAMSASTSDGSVLDFSLLSQEVSVIIIIMTAVLITCLILVTGYLCLKGKNVTRPPRTDNYTYDISERGEYPPSKRDVTITRGGVYQSKHFSDKDDPYRAPPAYDTTNEYAVIGDVIPDRRTEDYNTSRSFKSQPYHSYETPQYFELDSREAARMNTNPAPTSVQVLE